jgi:hypothetical protein
MTGQLFFDEPTKHPFDGNVAKARPTELLDAAMSVFAERVLPRRGLKTSRREPASVKAPSPLLSQQALLRALIKTIPVARVDASAQHSAADGTHRYDAAKRAAADRRCDAIRC